MNFDMLEPSHDRAYNLLAIMLIIFSYILDDRYDVVPYPLFLCRFKCVSRK